jgi:hypothetical protein
MANGFGVAGKWVEDERARMLQDGFGVADREERADPAALAPFARDLDG